jgi:ferric-dicitrate binding protein FerR (iron transport regulator)
MLRRKGMLLALVFAFSVLLVPLSWAQDQNQDQSDEAIATSQARIVRLSYAEGSVQLATDNGVENATVNVPLTEGTRLSTSSNGWAEVQLEDGSTIRLAPSTAVNFTELGRSSSGSTLTTIDLDGGEAEFNVSRRHDNEFAVTVRNKTVLLDHSGRFRITSTVQDPLELVVFKGEVKVKDPDSGDQVAVKKDETFSLDPEDPAHYALDKEAEADELDNWSQQRDEALSAYAARNSGDYAQSPYQYGLNDLNYYGTYYDVPGYGYLWQPTGVGPGWDPFMNGYWTWSPVGYCWVSAYPWGWMPYRFGHWIFVNGSGWMWQPGGWHGWWRQPRLVNTPPGFHPPAPPKNTIGIVARNPRIPTMPNKLQPGPRRVFTNENVERTPPAELNRHNDNGIGVVHAERRPAVVPRGGPDTQVPETQSPRTGTPATEAPGNRGSIGEVRRVPDRPPTVVPRTERPAPETHMRTAPAVVPRASTPPPAPAPHVSTPPPAPRSYSPPSAPRFSGGGGSGSRSSQPSSSPGRPK